MGISLYLYIIEVIVAVFIGVLALSRKRSRLEYSFFFFALAIASWQFFQLLAVLASGANHSLATHLLMTSVAMSALTASLLYMFIRVYSRKTIPYWSMITAAVFGSIAYFSPALEDTVITTSGISIPSLDYQYAVVLIYDLCILFIAIYSLVRFYTKTRDHKTKDQIRIILSGVTTAGLIALLASFSTSDFSKTVYAQHVIPLACIIGLLSLLYAITYKGLIDIKLATVRTGAYVLSLLTLSLMYYLMAYVASITFFKSMVDSIVGVSLVNVGLALVLAFAFQPIKSFFDKITSKVFYRDRYHTDEFYARVSEVLTSTTDLRSLLQRTAKEISTTLKAEFGLFFVQYDSTHHMFVTSHGPRKLPLQDIDILNSYIHEVGSDVIVTELLQKHTSVKRLLTSHKIGILMPLMRDDEMIGYLALGEHQASDYTNRDVRVLGTISDELVIAIQNALSVQQVKDINANLEQRIDMATAELRTSNARLRRVDATKDEFISMASHQLRTPLTSIKGYLSMVLEGDVGKVTPAQHKVLEEAFISSERMVHLIHDFLNVSRLQTGKFVLEKTEADLIKLVREEVEALKGVAKSRGISISYESPRGSLPVDVDDTKLRQVLVNFIDNALYYSPAGSEVVVTLRRLPDRIELTVADAGIGVPKDEQAQLFSKFYRASNARKHRPDGTGVGLYLARKIITAHGGDIIFLSKEGKGSTFGFWLPLENDANKLKDKPDND